MPYTFYVKFWELFATYITSLNFIIFVVILSVLASFIPYLNYSNHPDKSERKKVSLKLVFLNICVINIFFVLLSLLSGQLLTKDLQNIATLNSAILTFVIFLIVFLVSFLFFNIYMIDREVKRRNMDG